MPFFGWLSDVLGRRLVYGVGVVLTGLYAFPYFALLNTATGGLILLGIVLGLIFHDMMYGPQAALISESFGTGIRYTGAGPGLPARLDHRGRSGAADRDRDPRGDRVDDLDLDLHHHLRGDLDGRAADDAPAAAGGRRGGLRVGGPGGQDAIADAARSERTAT